MVRLGWLVGILTALALISPLGVSPIATSTSADTLPASDGIALRGDLHAHTAFSDGDGRPAEAFAAAKGAGLDFFAVTDHGEWLGFPFAAHSECVEPDEPRFLAASCFQPNSSMPQQLEWERTGDAAQAATDASFVALRGFEWSSPVEGHVNVFGTRLWTDSVQTGPAPMTPLYAWLEAQQLDPLRVASFNHPDREPSLRFDAFVHVPPADERFGTIEAFNRDDGHTADVLDAWDAGWHLGAIGVTDAHGPDDWTNLDEGHTVLIADSHTRAGILGALAEHRTVATLGVSLDARLTLVEGIEDTEMGKSMSMPEDGDVVASFRVKDFTGPTDVFDDVDLVGPQGYVIDDLPFGTSDVSGNRLVDLTKVPTTATGERYLALRASQDGRPVVLTSPVWITGS